MASAGIDASANALAETARAFHLQGFSPVTSGNYSARLSAERLLITQSGHDKGQLKSGDFLQTDMQGRPLSAGKPSAETPLHAMLYRDDPSIGCVLHVHAPSCAVLSRVCAEPLLVLRDWELLKALSGVDSHARAVAVPVFDNDQDMHALAERVRPVIAANRPCFGFLLRGHGLYAWGEDIAAARRHVETLDYLFRCELELLRLR